MVDMPWGDKRAITFATNVGLITSNGKHGNNIMACEWTHHVSYSPGLIAVCIGKNKATQENIIKSKEFGVNIAAIDQNVIASVSGTNHGSQVDKIAALKELGYNFFPGKKINALMVEGAAMQAECRLVKIVDIGDHPILIGEIIELYPATNKMPLVYHNQKYWSLTEQVKKPEHKELEKIREAVVKHKK